MNLDDFRILFLVGTLVLALFVASPLIVLVVPFGSGSERFSDFWLLGPNRMAESYPFDVFDGEEYNVFIGVGNRMSISEYYMVCVKFRNSTESFPDVVRSLPSALSTLYEYRFVVGANGVWESPVIFKFQDVSVEGDVVSVGNVVINGVPFPVDAVTVYDSEVSGFMFQLFFELWRYDIESQCFRFDCRTVGLWLNINSAL